ncbi:STAS domain-containing protein [Catellatospora chokoriensis]|uniref:STAS domain-containing protein n=1 Tax=Catellatospora chokoriensis TaxID=310353 RepID=A0A8J3NV84_9ACTN|nr:STAS domain-containing protein [Catellatospora chokoriensis]GIF93732.1 hypothetical protein Cch02nite_71760 [Catellatospora chokoriensis]
MTDALHLRLQDAASGLRLVARGRLCADTARQLGQAVSMALRRLRAARLTLDLAAVDTIDAAGVAALIRSRIEADRCNVILTITGPTPHVAEAMRSHAMSATTDTGSPTGRTGVLAVVLPFRTPAAAVRVRTRRHHRPHSQP